MTSEPRSQSTPGLWGAGAAEPRSRPGNSPGNHPGGFVRDERVERRRNLQLIDAVTNAAPLILWAMDADGTCTLSQGNGLTLLGLGRGELVGTNLFDYYRDDEPTLARYRRCLAGDSFQDERPVGDRRMTTWMEPLRGAEGGIEGVLGVTVDVTDRWLFEQAQRRAADQQRALLAQLFAVEEAERRRIAEDLHDDSIQVLAAVNIRVESLRRRLVDVAGPDSLRTQEQLSAVGDAVRTAVERMRRLIFELEPPSLSSRGIASALEDLLAFQFGERGPRWSLDVISEPPAVVGRLLYRIAHEAVTNASRHAHAQNVWLTLRQEDGGWRLQVSDDGAGITAQVDPAPGHLGLASMRERAAAAGGWCTVGRSDIGGTTVDAWVPERSRLNESLTSVGSSLRAPLAELLESITDAFVAIDDQWRYVYVNERAAQILGRPAQWLVGRCIWEVFPELVGSRSYLAYREAFAQQQTREFEDTADGRWLTHRVYPSSRGLTVFFQDISDRRRSELAAVSRAVVDDTLRAATLAAAAAVDPADGIRDVLTVLTSGLALDAAEIRPGPHDGGGQGSAGQGSAGQGSAGQDGAGEGGGPHVGAERAPVRPSNPPAQLRLALRAGLRSYGTLEVRRGTPFEELEEAAIRAVAALLALLLATRPHVIELSPDVDRAARREGIARRLR